MSTEHSFLHSTGTVGDMTDMVVSGAVLEVVLSTGTVGVAVEDVVVL